ncbi:retrovirus-related pol polyprotein from transposon TNT 1-94 [Tanacetum coccineum]|uniref:Retrovirus-related pol polyprotein from transposon TNT 1-94 n=1 Tax=Tanacetum coccineum TaxID=301880 RepID=A0ABQ5EWA9_9ASTR
MSFIKRVENQNEIKVKQLRTENGTKFINSILINFCDEKWISQNFSSPYIPEQNGAAEKKNRTLIEAARTMLSGSVFSKKYWTEDVATASYTQNIYTIVKRHLKTPYEIFLKRILNINFLHFPRPLESSTQEDSKLKKPITSHLMKALMLSNSQNLQLITSTLLKMKDIHLMYIFILISLLKGAGMLTRAMAKELSAASAHECLFVDFLSEEEPKKVSKALKHPGWVDAMQDKLNQFSRNKVWTLVPAPYGKTIIGLKWQEGIDYDETFSPVARLEAIRIFLAFATYMNFVFYQMDVKSAILNGKLKEEVYVKQPPDFESYEFPNHVCKLDKALYGLKQAPRAWYETLSTILTEHKFVRGKINNTLFVYKTQTDVILVQIYVDDIIFWSTSIKLCKQFAKLMTQRYEMSMMGVLTYFLRFKIKQSERGISFNQEKYVKDLLKRYQANPKESDLTAIKRIFRYLKGTPNLGGKLVCRSARKQQSVAMSSGEAEYVAAAGCCANILWMKSQLTEYDIIYEKVTIFCENTSAIAILNNLVLHSRTKHIDIRYHFIRDHILKGDIELHFIPTQYQLADIFIKPLDEPTFKRLIVKLGMLNINSKLEASVLNEEN